MGHEADFQLKVASISSRRNRMICNYCRRRNKVYKSSQ